MKILLALLMVLASSSALAAGGEDPFKPRRGDWAALVLNAELAPAVSKTSTLVRFAYAGGNKIAIVTNLTAAEEEETKVVESVRVAIAGMKRRPGFEWIELITYGEFLEMKIRSLSK